MFRRLKLICKKNIFFTLAIFIWICYSMLFRSNQNDGKSHHDDQNEHIRNALKREIAQNGTSKEILTIDTEEPLIAVSDLVTTTTPNIWHDNGLNHTLEELYEKYFSQFKIKFDPSAPGWMGKPVELPDAGLSPEEKDSIDKGWALNGFNQHVSDLIPLQRRVPRGPDPECAVTSFDPATLPQTSIIIVFYNEAMSTLLRTVYSALNTAPEYLVAEIILVDDCSDMGHLKDPLDYFVARNFNGKVRVVRSDKRIGLTQARVFGVKAATAETYTFLDAHCECAQGWLEPLLEQVALNYTNVPCPTIDVIMGTTFEYKMYSGKFSPVGGFNWLLDFVWVNRPLYQWSKRASLTAPTMSPTMLGGLFTIHSQWFKELGYYDPGLDLYGSEHLELSFKVWMCGGQVLNLACSHVGHVFRSRTPYLKPIEPVLRRNKLRVAAVWMDGYKHYYDKTIRFDPMAYGDVSERLQLRESLKCHDFAWYLRNIFPQRYYPLAYDAFGTVKTAAVDLCLAANFAGSKDHGKHVPIITKTCSIRDEHQAFILETESKHFRIEMSCLVLDPDSNELTMIFCDQLNPDQKWIYEPSMQIRHSLSGKCLQLSETPAISLEACDKSLKSQIWHWSRTEL